MHKSNIVNLFFLEKKERVVTSEDIEARLKKHMEEIKAKAAEEAKKINLPGYLNPAMVNVAQFKQVQEKRKLLWSKAKNKVIISLYFRFNVVAKKLITLTVNSILGVDTLPPLLSEKVSWCKMVRG